MSPRMSVHDRGHIGPAPRRFSMLIERTGMRTEVRAPGCERPCDTRRRKEAGRRRAILTAKAGPRKAG